MRVEFGKYVVSDDHSKLDLQAIHRMLRTSYWASERPIETTAKSIEGSHCFGVYDENGDQVAYARVVSDRATMFYLADVIVDEKLRGEGIGKALVSAVLESDEYRGITGMLATKDAHGLYEKYGFQTMPDTFMRRLPLARK